MEYPLPNRRGFARTEPASEEGADTLRERQRESCTEVSFGGIKILHGEIALNRLPALWPRPEASAVCLHFRLALPRQGRKARAASPAGAALEGHNVRYSPHPLPLPAGTDKTLFRVVEVRLSLEYFFRLAGKDSRILEHFAERILNQQPVELAPRDLPITPQIKVALFQLMNCPWPAGLKKLYLEAKVLELLALQCAQAEASAPDDTPCCCTRHEDMERIYQVKEILVARYDNPPSLLQLARMVGLNDFKLKKQFKEVFGNTVYGYLLHLKMEKAKQLLLEGHRPVNEISELVGYKSPAHFATAFKKNFGFSPSELRN